MTPIAILATVLAYFAVLFLVSSIARRNVDNAAFFTGSRQSKWYMVAFAMIGASISGVTYVSVPGMVSQSGLATCNWYWDLSLVSLSWPSFSHHYSIVCSSLRFTNTCVTASDSKLTTWKHGSSSSRRCLERPFVFSSYASLYSFWLSVHWASPSGLTWPYRWVACGFTPIRVALSR